MEQIDTKMDKLEISSFFIPNLFEQFETYKYPNKNPTANIIPYQCTIILPIFNAMGFKLMRMLIYGKTT